jgi:hypothetical protein
MPLKIKTESRSLQSRQIYAARQDDFMGIWRKTTMEGGDLRSLPATKARSPLPLKDRVAPFVERVDRQGGLVLPRQNPLTGLVKLNPLTRLNKTKKSPAPRFHAATLLKDRVAPFVAPFSSGSTSDRRVQVRLVGAPRALRHVMHISCRRSRSALCSFHVDPVPPPSSFRQDGPPY